LNEGVLQFESLEIHVASISIGRNDKNTVEMNKNNNKMEEQGKYNTEMKRQAKNHETLLNNGWLPKLSGSWYQNGGALGVEWMKAPWSRRDPWKGVEASF